ncbi:MAG TPA: UDP-N-acetylmuramate--L-alanine ligase [Pirellulales bacterium]
MDDDRAIAAHSALRGKPQRAHLIGIAGSGMRSLATVLLARGWRISGSDANPSAADHLLSLGARVIKGHSARNVPNDSDWIIHSDAVPPENVERRRAAELRLRSASYTEMLAELSREATTLAVAGTHGKSTTTAMAGAAIVRSGLDPTMIGGGVPIGCWTGGRSGAGRHFLVEACEYRANFLLLRPQIAVVLGIEQDHFDYYSSKAQLIDAFCRFAARVPLDGLLIVNRDCAAARELVRSVSCRVATFGLRRGADWTAERLQTRRGRYRFWLAEHGRPLVEVVLRKPGKHNVTNALAAAALSIAAGADAESVADALSSFRGLKRRLEVKGTRGGIAWIDDYAHHPTEIRAALSTVRAMYPGRRLWCLFQPHQVSRTAALLDELAESLHNADKIALAEIFRAREPIARSGEVTAADLAARTAGLGGDVLEEHDTDRLIAGVANELCPGDVLITMGAGDIGKIGHAIFQRLRKDRARS